jgi:hypothetical protein
MLLLSFFSILLLTFSFQYIAFLTNNESSYSTSFSISFNVEDVYGFPPSNAPSSSNLPSDSGGDSNGTITLKYEAGLIPEEFRNSEQKRLTHTVKVWIEGPLEILSQIDKVIYYPQPSKYFPGNVERTNASENFSHSWNVWGTFPLKADVFFKDGEVTRLSQYISFS